MADTFELSILDGGHPEPGEALGRIRISDFTEVFCLSLRFWSAADYRQSWRRSIEHLLSGGQAAVSCLITSITDPSNSNFVMTWALYRERSVVHVQNSVVFLDEQFDPGMPWLAIQPRVTLNEDGMRISEWRTELTAIRSFGERLASS